MFKGVKKGKQERIKEKEAKKAHVEAQKKAHVEAQEKALADADARLRHWEWALVLFNNQWFGHVNRSFLKHINRLQCFQFRR